MFLIKSKAIHFAATLDIHNPLLGKGGYSFKVLVNSLFLFQYHPFGPANSGQVMNIQIT